MTKRIILHIGMPKTGTTAIQAFCVNNVELLEKQGVGYYIPKQSVAYAGYRGSQNAPALSYLALHGKGTADLREEAEYEMKCFADYSQRYETQILSDEDLYGPWTLGKPEKEIDGFWGNIRETLESYLGKDLSIDVVLYIRRQDTWVESHWKMMSNNFSNICATAWEYAREKNEAKILDYDTYCRHLERNFGREHVKLRVYDRIGEKGEIIQQDFIQTCGLSWDEDFVIHKDRANISITGECAWAMHYINRNMPDLSIDRYWLTKAVNEYSTATPEQVRTHVMTDGERDKLMAMCEEGNRAVAERYFDGRDLFPEHNRSYRVCTYDPVRDEKNAKEIIRRAYRSRREDRILGGIKKHIFARFPKLKVLAKSALKLVGKR